MVSMLLTEDGETNTITKTVTVNAPPAVTFGWDPDSPLVGQGVDFQSQVNDPETTRSPARGPSGTAGPGPARGPATSTPRPVPTR